MCILILSEFSFQMFQAQSQGAITFKIIPSVKEEMPMKEGKVSKTFRSHHSNYYAEDMYFLLGRQNQECDLYLGLNFCNVTIYSTLYISIHRC